MAEERTVLFDGRSVLRNQNVRSAGFPGSVHQCAEIRRLDRRKRTGVAELLLLLTIIVNNYCSLRVTMEKKNSSGS